MSALQGPMRGPMGGFMVGGTRPASGGVTEPATGTVIIGNSAPGALPGSDIYPWADNVHGDSTAVAAAWSESASTTTLGKIMLRAAGWDGGNLKGLLYSSVGSLLATTNALAVVYGSEQTFELTFSSPPTITKGTSYILCFIFDTSYAVRLNIRTGTGNFDYNQSGTYASPPTTIGSWGNVQVGQAALWGVK